MKGMGMLVVSLWGVNFGFWTHLAFWTKRHKFSACVVSLAAVLCLVTQRSSPQTAAHIRTTFLSHCFCGLMKGPIMYQQIENDVSVPAKKDNGTSGRSFSY